MDSPGLIANLILIAAYVVVAAAIVGFGIQENEPPAVVLPMSILWPLWLVGACLGVVLWVFFHGLRTGWKR